MELSSHKHIQRVSYELSLWINTTGCQQKHKMYNKTQNILFTYMKIFFHVAALIQPFFIFKQEQHLNGMKGALSQPPAGKAIQVSFKSCFYQKQISSLFTIMFQVISAFWKNSFIQKGTAAKHFQFSITFFSNFYFHNQ